MRLSFALIAPFLVGACGFFHPISFPSLHSDPTCTGGARLVGHECQCALGTTWNGQTCQGTAQAGICGGGGVQFGKDQCFCPDGTVLNAAAQCEALSCQGGAVASGNACVCLAGATWDAASSQCLALNCQGGSIVDGNGCSCPAPKVWADNQCEVTCPPGGVRIDADSCGCPDGTVFQGQELGCQLPTAAEPVAEPPPDNTCTGNAVLTADGNCVCVNGQIWDGAQCLDPAPGAPPVEVKIHVDRYEMPRYPSPPFVARFGDRGCREFTDTQTNQQACINYCTTSLRGGTGVRSCNCVDMDRHCDGHVDKPVRVK